MTDRPHWQLPRGVTRGIWEYVHSDSVADDYDSYFAQNQLFDFDQQVIVDRVTSRGEAGDWVVDLGCGTGRVLVHLARRGFTGLAVDLSEPMLENVQQKAEEESLDIHCLKCNLVELDCVADDSVAFAVCMFSTLGMIRGAAHRQQVLDHVRRILRPGGQFIFHVHNFWFNLYDPGGPWWLLRNLAESSVRRDIERGDKYFNYRGVHNMFLHVFTHRELQRVLRKAGFRKTQFIWLHPQRHRGLKAPWFFGQLRANGWIVVCE